MNRSEQIEKELAMAEAALGETNDGKARVCARRAVALAAAVSRPSWRGDAMHQLRQIHQEETFPLPIRQAAERLSTKITQRDTAPFTSNPIADAKLIIAYLIPAEPERTS